MTTAVDSNTGKTFCFLLETVIFNNTTFDILRVTADLCQLRYGVEYNFALRATEFCTNR